jgi:hypothetical protein
MSEGEELKGYYIRTWHEMLSAFLGWTDQQTERWLEAHIVLNEMDNPDDLYYHESPQYWVLSALIPESLQGRLAPKQCAELRSRLLLAFKDEHFYWFPLGSNWLPFKEKVEEILREYRVL